MTNNNSFDRVRTTGLQYTNAWVDSTFEPYALPSNLGQDVIDPVDDHIQYRCQCHYLGPAYIKYGDLPSIHVDFYKVIRSEISQLVYDKKKSGQRYSHGGADGGAALSSPEGTEVCHYLSETVHVAAVSQVERSNNIGASFGLFSTSTSPSPTASPTSTTATATAAMTTTTTIPLMLPLKKRKKRRVTQQYVIFSFHRDGATHSALPSSLPPDCTYYLFPQHSLTTVINDMAPLQMLCTFHLSQQQPSTHTGLSDDHGATTAYSPPSGIQYRTKLEELAAICSSTEHLSSGTNDSTSTPSWSSVKYDSIHVNILEASLDLYYSLKEAGTGCHGSFDGKADLAHTHNRLLEMYKIDSTLHSDQGQEPRAKISRRHTTTGEEIITTTDDSPLLFSTKRKYMSIGGNQTPLVKSEVDTGDKDYPHATKKKKTKRMSANNGKHDSNATARTRQCTYCSATSTPMWRRGPEGAGTLCNACGVKWKHGKILNGDDTPTDQKPHTGKPSCKRKRSATSAYTKEKRAKPIEPGALLHQSTDSTVAPPPMDLRLHEHVCYAQDTLDSIRHDSNLITSTSITTHERSVGILTASASPSSSNESFGHSPFTSFTSSPTSIDSQHHPLVFLTDKFGVNDDDLTLTSAAADVEAAAVLTLLSQS